MPAPKGASTHILAFAKRLGMHFGSTGTVGRSSDCRNANVLLVTPGETDIATRPLLAGVEQIVFGCRSDNPIGRARIFQAKLRELLQHERYAVIHFRSPFEGLVAIDPQLNQGAKLVYEANGFPSIEMKYHYPQLIANPHLRDKLYRQEIRCLEASDRIITVSQVTQDYVRSRVNHPAKVELIRNGFDAEKVPYQVTSLHDGEPIRIAYIGTFVSWQGIETLLDAVSLVTKERPCHLTLVGAASVKRTKELQRVIHKLRIEASVSLLPGTSQSELLRLLHDSHIAAVPLLNVDRNLLQGCCPIKLLEVMASGCPVVASDLPVVRELANEGEHFFPARAGDPLSWKNVFLDVTNRYQDAIQVAKQARRHVETHLTWRQSGDQLIRVYDALLNTPLISSRNC